MHKFQDVKGKKFGRLTALSVSHRINYRTYWLCMCDCGKEKITTISHLNSGKTKSCGCYNKERIKETKIKHGLYDRKYRYELYTYRNMINRCYNKKTKGYKYYGERGIKVCDSWLLNFEYFFKDMGFRPSDKHSIDRIDVNGNYEKSNCRWATKKEQIKNRRPTKNKTGYSGVSLKGNSFHACIRINKKTIYLGAFKKAKDAHEAWKEAKKNIYKYDKN